MARIITISREFGSGGRTIGRIVAQELGYNFYDRELVDAVAAESGMTPKFIEEKGEYANSTRSFLFNLAITGGTAGSSLSMYDRVFIAQSKLIKQFAQEGSCVIVGRCADYILRERTDTLHVFVHADIKSRVERIVNVYGETDKAPEKRLAEKDEKRRVYYKNYTGTDWGNMRNYQLTVDSGFLGIEKCAQLIIDCARE